MWLGLAVLLVESLSIINAYPSQENVLGSEISRRDDLASILGGSNVLAPGESSSFNGGATAGDAVPVNFALAPSGEIASPVDQPLGDIYQIGETPNLPIDQALGESFGLDVGLLNQLSGDTTLQSNGNTQEEEQQSDEQFLGDQEAAAGDVPCDPQQSAKLRRRAWCKAPVDSNAKPAAASSDKRRGRGRRPGQGQTQPTPDAQVKLPLITDTLDDQCIHYSGSTLPLGVCSSPKPHTIFSSLFKLAGAPIQFFTLKRATLGKFYILFLTGN